MAGTFLQLVLEADVATLRGDDIIECMKEVERARTALDSLAIALVRQAHEHHEAELDGLRSAAAWLEHHTGIPAQTSRERQRVGDRLEHLPMAAKQFEAGLLPYSKARALTAVWSPELAETMARDEQLLVDQAGQLTVRQYTQAIRFWKACTQPDDPDADVTWRARRAYLSATMDGVHHLHAVLDAESGGEFASVLDAISHELWQADQGAARAAGPDAERTPAQRRADALVELARRAATAPAGGRRPRPSAHLIISHDTYAHGVDAAILNHQTPISASAARRLCCDANIARVITDPESAVIDLGEARNPSGPLRRLIWARDRTCVFPGCSIAATRCDVHHVVAHHNGGPTELTNLATLCAHHHRLTHQHGFGCVHDTDRTELIFTRPDGSHLGTRQLKQLRIETRKDLADDADHLPRAA